MKENDAHQDTLEQITAIRSMMEKSSRFISLSGLSGVFAGLTALAGAWLAYRKISVYYGSIDTSGRNRTGVIGYWDDALMMDLVMIAMGVLIVALAFGLYFTMRKAGRHGHSMWDNTSRRMVFNLLIPLGVGGLFCLVLMYHNIFGLVAPATLIFYGLALINASKYTLNDIRYLGYCQIVLGLISSVLIGSGLIFWAIGFGVMHIVYGAVMYYKYDRI